MTLFALTNHGAWGIALIIGLVAALAVAALLGVLIRAVQGIDESAKELLDVAGKVAGNTANIPQLQATAPVLSQIVDEAIIQDGYMNALTDGFGEVRASRTAHAADVQARQPDDADAAQSGEAGCQAGGESAAERRRSA